MRKEFDVSFVTPAFLGNAEQQAQWRTPPFKALLRQWWRIWAWRDMGGTMARLLNEEGEWFGVADTSGTSRQSRIKLRLNSWDKGRLTEWPKKEPQVHHPEVGNGGRNIGAELYLGFGPLAFEKNAGTALAVARGTQFSRSAIEPGQHAQLSIAAPENFPLDDLLKLVNRFGTLGSRSRNGWGSLEIANVELPDQGLLDRVSRPLGDCFDQDWPHALGRDENGFLMWKTKEAYDTWRGAMHELARVKIAFRTHFAFQGGGPHRTFQERHLFAYPVTHHAYAPWGNETRNANQLRFKVVRDGERFRGLAFHLPCRLPLPHGPGTHDQIEIWKEVHEILNREMMRMGNGV